MAQCLLWMGLALLGTLQTQAQDCTPNLYSSPPVSKIPLQPNFQNKLFQGKWYAIGLAGNEIKKKHRLFKMFTATYKLNKDDSYNIKAKLVWKKRCEPWARTFVPSPHQGLYTLGNIERYTGTLSFTFGVVATDYKKYALVFFKKVRKNQEYFMIVLYGGTKELTSGPKNLLIAFAKSMGLQDHHIVFTIPNGNLQLGE
ncbi:NGAL protein, partial [Crocuta crocuta]